MASVFQMWGPHWGEAIGDDFASCDHD